MRITEMSNFTMIVISIILVIFNVGCQKHTEYPANIIVLLDISDRVSEEKYGKIAIEQVNSDIKNCQTIIDVFRDIVKTESFSNSKSKLRFLIPDQQGFQVDSEYKTPLLGLAENPMRTYTRFNQLERDVTTKIRELYDIILRTPQNQFTGSDLWSWFKYESERYIDPGYKNYIICLSDGYLDFDSNIQKNRDKGTYIVIDDDLRRIDDWRSKVYGEYRLSVPQGLDFSEYTVQFLMIGIKDRTTEGLMRDRDIIEAYWDPWLNTMGIRVFDFLPSVITDDEIKGFLDVKNRINN